MLFDLTMVVPLGQSIQAVKGQSEKKLAFDAAYAALAKKKQMPPKHTLNFEELVMCFADKRFLPDLQEDLFEEFKAAYDLVQKTPDKSKLDVRLRVNMINTTVCPRALFIRINVVLFSRGDGCLPNSGHPNYPKNYPGYYLNYVAHDLGAAALVGACWGVIAPTNKFGPYISKMTGLYQHCLNQLKTYYFDLSDKNVYNSFIALINLGKIKAKTNYQEVVGAYHGNERADAERLRDLAYHSKLDEVLKGAYCRYQSTASIKKETLIPREVFLIEAGRLLKLLTEYSICDFPLPIRRLRLMAKLGERVGYFPKTEYIEILAAMLYYGVLTENDLPVFEQPAQCITEAMVIRDLLVSRHGVATAQYVRGELKEARVAVLQRLDEDINMPGLNDTVADHHQQDQMMGEDPQAGIQVPTGENAMPFNGDEMLMEAENMFA
jgi:hypothetical protein